MVMWAVIVLAVIPKAMKLELRELHRLQQACRAAPTSPVSIFGVRTAVRCGDITGIDDVMCCDEVMSECVRLYQHVC